MSPDAFNAFCQSLPHTHHVVQWGDADVWKVGRPEKGKNKVFVVGGWRRQEDAPNTYCMSFHCSEIAFEFLKATPGCRPAPYLAARGMTWIQRFNDSGVSDESLKDYIANSHRLMAAKLTKKIQRELNLYQ